VHTVAVLKAYATHIGWPSNDELTELRHTMADIPQTEVAAVRARPQTKPAAPG
jgi:hypothetical protein